MKTRIGFDDPAVFDELLSIFSRHSLDLLTVHARTVKEMYRATTCAEFFALCRQYLDHDNPRPLEPFPIALKSTDVMAGAMR